MNHGHVKPNPDGSRARCGGPSICSVCALELAQSKKPVQTLETSKELLRCADWMVCRNGMADYEPTMDDFLRWSGIIRSLVIPEPLNETEKD